MDPTVPARASRRDSLSLAAALSIRARRHRLHHRILRLLPHLRAVPLLPIAAPAVIRLPVLSRRIPLSPRIPQALLSRRTLPIPHQTAAAFVVLMASVFSSPSAA